MGTKCIEIDTQKDTWTELVTQNLYCNHTYRQIERRKSLFYCAYKRNFAKKIVKSVKILYPKRYQNQCNCTRKDTQIGKNIPQMDTKIVKNHTHMCTHP